MTVRKIVEYPDPVLQTPTKSVVEVDAKIEQLVADMLATMYNSPGGIGLAANQIGVAKRVFVMDMSDDKNDPMVFINPKVVAEEGSIEYTEGCLSFPGLTVQVMRAQKITIEALDLKGNNFSLTRDDYSARCMLHELDHLDGVTFLDYFKPVKRKLLERKLNKLRSKRM